MNKKIADLILAWHEVYLALHENIEHARVVLDQSDRGTLLPDRVREMRGHLIAVQARIPALADLMEELIDKTVWPMKVPDIEDESPSPVVVPEAEEAAERATDAIDPPPVTAPGDYDAEGATPGADEEVEEEALVDEEAAAETQSHSGGELEAE